MLNDIKSKIRAYLKKHPETQSQYVKCLNCGRDITNELHTWDSGLPHKNMEEMFLNDVGVYHPAILWTRCEPCHTLADLINRGILYKTNV